MDNTKHIAADGKVWRHKKSGVIGGKELMLGSGDSIENWEEVDEMESIKENLL